MVKMVNRAKMSTPTTGTGTLTLGSAITGYQTFSASGVANADVVRYTIEDGAAWEIGLGTYTASGTLLSRTLEESSTGSLLNLSGNAEIFVTAAAADVTSDTANTASTLVARDASGNFSAGTVTADGLSLGDNDKATFGAGNDLEIYHNGSNSYVQDTGTGKLHITSNGTGVSIDKGTSELMATFDIDGAVTLYHDSAAKLATTSTGIDVTGTATMDGLTVDGATTLNSTSTSPLKIQRNSGTSSNVSIEFDGATQDFFAGIGAASEDFVVGTNANLNIDNRLRIAASGDISFYDSVGTTPKFFWDASAERLGVGTTNPQADLVISENGVQGLEILAWEGGDTVRLMGFNRSTSLRVPVTIDASQVIFQANTTTERMRIDSSGDISFYEDTGTTPKFFWDASAEALALGTSTSVSNNRLVINQASGDGQNSGFYMQRNGGAGTSFKIDIDSDDVVNFRRSISTAIAISSSGNVGIGTSSPTNPLHITATNPTVYLETSGGGATDAAYVQKFSNDFYIYNKETSGKLFLGTNNSTKLTIDSSGNVGIGESNPQELLHLTDTTPVFRMEGASRAYQQYVSGTSFFIRDVTAGLNRVTLDSSGDISFYEDTGTTPKFFWDASAESLGIGTTSPTYKLHVRSEDASDDVAYIHHDNASQSSGTLLKVRSDAGASSGYSLLDVQNNSGTALYVAGDNKVGIGTTSPVNKLHLLNAGTTAISNGIANSGMIVDGGSGNAALNLITGDAEVCYVNFGDSTDSNIGRIFYQHTDNSMVFSTNVAERMRITSSGNVGIGTSSPSQALEIAGSVRIDNGASFTAYEIYRDNILYGSVGGGSNQFTLQASNSKSINLFDDSGVGLTVKDGGNVGIGTSSPATNLDILDTSETILTIRASDSSGTRTAIRFQDGGTGTGTNGLFIGRSFGGNYISTNQAEPLIFTTNGTEAMRVDASNNLLVGTTSTPTTLATTSSEAGLGFDAAYNFLIVSRAAAPPFNLNRLTNDGDIINLRKNGSIVGSIGTEGGDLTIGNADTGLQFVNTSQIIRPQNLTTNLAIDAQVNLGQSAYRFKDLYLSGGVYLGGTVAANKLDDYEEGTWTPSYTAATGGATYAVQTGSYTKVGNKVTVIAELQADRNTLSGTIKISGLPFSATGTGGGFYPTFAMRFGSDMPNLKGYVTTTEINLRKQATNATASTVLTETDLSNAGTAYNYLYFTATYFTTA
jgi:hypothetical protein